LAQVVVDEREQLRRGVRGAGLGGAQHLRDVGHKDIVANPVFAVTSSSLAWVTGSGHFARSRASGTT
jgi:hypothetical protein